MRRSVLLVFFVAFGYAARSARAESLVFGPTDVPTVFVIRKTENRNRVEYGIHLDSHCVPEGRAPIVPYWRMLERGASIVEALGRVEFLAYGIASQVVRAEPNAGGRVTVRLRPLPDHPILVTSTPSKEGCIATATTTIAGKRARIRDILVVLSGRVAIDHVEIDGVTVDDGSPVHENVVR